MTTITNIQWQWGSNQLIEFNPAVDTLNFGWFSANDFTLTERDGSVIISIPSNQQSYTLKGVSFSELRAANIIANDQGALSTWNAYLTRTPESSSVPAPLPSPEPIKAAGEVITNIGWAWGSNTKLNFNPATDKLNFGWNFQSSQFTLTEVNGSSVIGIPSNNQSITLSGITLSALSISNFQSNDDGVLKYIGNIVQSTGSVQATEVTPTPIPTPVPISEPRPVDPVPISAETPADVTPAPAPVQVIPVPAPVPAPPVDGGHNTSNGGPIIAAYFPEWAIYSRDFNVADVPADNLTHLIYAFSMIDTSGRMSLFDSYAATEKTFNSADSVDGKADTWDQQLAGNFNQIAELKEANPGLKSLIAVGGWTLSGTFSDVAATAAGRTIFADSVVTFLQKYDMFDGIDFDWEYPGGGGLESNRVRPEDGANFVMLIQDVRDKLDMLEASTGRTYQISVASPAGADKIANHDLAGMAKNVDFFNLMAYDFHGGWEATTGHQAPMFDTIGGNYDITTAVELYLAAGVAPNAIVLGAPAYTRAWSGVQDGGDGGWNAPSTGLAQGSYERGVYDYKDLVQQINDPASGWAVYWDDNAQAAYAYNKDERLFSTLETPSSIALKSQWAQSKGLGGVMLWDLSGDITTGPDSLSGAIYKSWYEGQTPEQIAAASSLNPHVVIGGNGVMDSFVDFVYTPLVFDSVIRDTGRGTIAPNDVGSISVVTNIEWNWGVNEVLNFNTETDVLNFGWMGADSFSTTELNGSVVISIPTNNQSYILDGVTLNEMSMVNIIGQSSSTVNEWAILLG
jgi:GH18 family chitinase